MRATDRHFSELSTLLRPVAGELEAVRACMAETLGAAPWPAGDHLARLDMGGGKMLRPALTLLSGQSLGSTRNEHITLGAVVEMIHLASLLHDDVIDQARTRRGTASANVLWGNTQAVLLGDFVLSKAFGMAATLDVSQAAEVLCQTAEAICTGEMQQNLRKGDPTLTESDYLAIIEGKTASLFGACCCLGALASQAEPDLCEHLRRYGVALGMAFQMTDDLLDILGSSHREGKTLGTDLLNEKLTLPVIAWLREGDRSRRQAEFDRFVERSDCQALRGVIGQSEAVDYTLGRAEAFARSARQSLSPLPDTSAKTALLGLVDYVLARAAR